MGDFEKYKRSNVAEMRPVTGIELSVGLDPAISVSEPDQKNGSPRSGDMIARNPQNHEDMWLVAEKYFSENFEEIKEE